MLHRTRQQVFDGDLRALTAGRDKINLEFKQKKHVSNEESINEVCYQFFIKFDRKFY